MNRAFPTALPRNSPLRDWLGALVLAAFVARAMIPMGFMPAGDGHFGLMLCTGVAAPTDAASKAAGSALPNAADAHHPPLHARAACPFAVIPSPTALPTFPSPAVAIVQFVDRISIAAPAYTVNTAGPTRTQTPRGPPALS